MTIESHTARSQLLPHLARLDLERQVLVAEPLLAVAAATQGALLEALPLLVLAQPHAAPPPLPQRRVIKAAL